MGALDAVTDWREKLLDLSKRNRLINCGTGKTGAVKLEHPDPAALWQSLVCESGKFTFPWRGELLDGNGDEDDEHLSFRPAGDGRASDPANLAQAGALETTDHFDEYKASRFVAADHILTRLTDKVLGRKLQRLALNAQTSLSEQGVNTLFLALGVLRWFESKDSDVPLHAPLLLVQATLHRRSLDSPWELSLSEEEIIPNHCLRQALLDNFRIELPDIDEDALLAGVSGLQALFAAVRHLVVDHPRWGVLEDVLLGNFTFQKVAMWEDLGTNGDQIAAHPICRALAGDTDEVLGPTGVAPAAARLDDIVHPKDAFHILPCDSSQQEAIEAVKAGMSLVLDGPPGTGKSQTIANVIAECLAQGQKVLFVSEKSAALEVVKGRLDKANLGDFCLDCHSHKANKKQVITELGRCLSLRPESYEAQEQRLEELRRSRGQLNAYVRALHRKRGALDVSPFQMHGRLAALQDQPLSRCTISDPLGIDAAKLAELRDSVAALMQCGPVINGNGPHPWRGCTVTQPSLTLDADIRFHFPRLGRLLSRLAEESRGLAASGFLAANPPLRDIESAIEVATAAAKFPGVPREWFTVGLRVTANRYIRLDTIVREFKHLRQTVAQYAVSAIGAPWEMWLGRLASIGPHRGLFAPDVLAGARTAVPAVGAIIADVQNLSMALRTVRQAADNVVAQLRVPVVNQPTLQLLPKLIKIAELVAQLGPIHPSWMQPLRRAELRDIAKKGKNEAAAIATERAALFEQFAPPSVESDARKLLEQVIASRSCISRLLPSWRARRSAFCALYRDKPPAKSKALLKDAERLLEFQRRYERQQQLGKLHGGELRATPLGNVDWDGVLVDLDVLDQLGATARLPPQMTEVLSTGAIDREQLLQAAQVLQERSAAIDSLLAAVQRNYDVMAAGAAGKELNQFADWLDSLAHELTELRSALAEIAATLREGQDVAPDECTVHGPILVKLARLRDHIREVHYQFGDIEPDNETPEELDWTNKAELGKWALGFIDQYGEHPSTPLIEAACDPAIRSRLKETLARIAALPDDELHESWSFVESIFPSDREISVGITINSTPARLLAPWLSDRAADIGRAAEWIAFQAADDRLHRLSLSTLLNEVTSRTIALDRVGDAFLARFYRTWLDAAYRDDAGLRHFSVDDHERLIGRFRELDESHVENNFKRVRALRLQTANPDGAEGLDAPSSSEMGILRREVVKKKRHLPLRKLFKLIPTLLQRLKPCMMMSPLAVSTYLDSKEVRFDAVIFDEASQVRPHDAVCAIYRGRQLIVAGDPKQLPPTNFFERQTDDVDEDEEAEEDPGDLSDFESILDVCTTLKLPRKRLQWHYRSRRESLIAFSNENFYEGGLVTFPSAREADGSGGVRLDYVPNGRWQSGATGGFNATEAARTADLVVQHIRGGSGLTLGVVTMNQRQQYQVLDELEKRRRENPGLEPFFDTANDEPFFVKNLENVQGDERDVIFLSVGYAPDQTGTMAMRFGPLNVDGGERRLNVAITRARFALTLISSIRANDIDLTRVRSVGARLLRGYLDFAERGVEALKSVINDDGTHDPDSPFEVEVARELRKHGLNIRAQVGCGPYRIDLAALHPEHPGRYVLGIECDGATYHSGATARDRDRLRQLILEELGWRMVRIWSTDWVRERERQVRKVLAAYEHSLRHPSPNELQPPHRTAPKVREEDAKQTPVNGTRNGNGHTAALFRYERIEDVPTSVIDSLLQRTLEESGATEEDDLIAHVARQLGFQRTGNRISAKINYVIQNLVRRGSISRGEDGRLQAKSRTGPRA